MCVDRSMVTILGTKKNADGPHSALQKIIEISIIHTTLPCQTFMEDVKGALVPQHSFAHKQTHKGAVIC